MTFALMLPKAKKVEYLWCGMSHRLQVRFNDDCRNLPSAPWNTTRGWKLTNPHEKKQLGPIFKPWHEKEIIVNIYFCACVFLVAGHQSEWLRFTSVCWRYLLFVPWSRSSLRSDTQLSASLLLLFISTIHRWHFLIATLYIFAWVNMSSRCCSSFSMFTTSCLMFVVGSKFLLNSLKGSVFPLPIILHLCEEMIYQYLGNHFHPASVTTKVKVCEGEMLRYCLFFVLYQPQKVT